MPAARLLVASFAVLALAGCGQPANWVTGTSLDLPNLVATQFASTPEHFVLGQEVTVHITVQNRGRVAAGPFDVEYAVTPHGGYYPWPRDHVAGLAPGESAVVDFVNEVSSPEDVPIQVTVDPDNQVRESSETDNITRYTVHVESAGG
jgi:subtilase family serine protease